MNNVKYFLCPMSKNVVDSILEIKSDKIGITATRRQIDYNHGYVNNWTTEDFKKYVGNNIIIERDHGGPHQGTLIDDGFESFRNDSKVFNIIHIDPWKFHYDLSTGIIETVRYIKFINNLNPEVRFEIGTEESIRKFSPNELNFLLRSLHHLLDRETFEKIEYVVIQSGEYLDLMNKRNIGLFNKNRFNEMLNICDNYNIKTKEHNGDFLTDDEYKFRFDLGLSAINIGPELSIIETNSYMEHMTEKEITEFYDICLNSEKWKRWVDGNVYSLDKKHLIQICGHYNYGKMKLPDIDTFIKEKITNKLKNLIQITNG